MANNSFLFILRETTFQEDKHETTHNINIPGNPDDYLGASDDFIGGSYSQLDHRFCASGRFPPDLYVAAATLKLATGISIIPKP